MNSQRGIITEEIENREFKFVFSINAMCLLEDKFGRGIEKIARDLETNPSIGNLRTMFWSALQAYHPEISIEEAGEIMQAFGITESGELIGRIMAAAFPREDREQKNPPKVIPKARRING